MLIHASSTINGWETFPHFKVLVHVCMHVYVYVDAYVYTHMPISVHV